MSKCKTQIEIKYELKYKTKNIEYSITVFPSRKKGNIQEAYFDF